jgi:hypothetical protein
MQQPDEISTTLSIRPPVRHVLAGLSLLPGASYLYQLGHIAPEVLQSGVHLANDSQPSGTCRHHY